MSGAGAVGDSEVRGASNDVADEWETLLPSAPDCLPLTSTSSEPPSHVAFTTQCFLKPTQPPTLRGMGNELAGNEVKA